MSLGIAFKGPEGIVLAADSRVTLTAEKQRGEERMMFPSTFDNATKLLQIAGHNYVGAVTYGVGAIGQQEPRTAHSFLPEFEDALLKENIGRLAVEDFAVRFSDFFTHQWADKMPDDYSGPDMVFLIGGFDKGSPYGRVFKFNIPSNPVPEEQNAGQFGVTWGGQLEYTTRLIKGFDPQLPSVVQNFLGLTDEQRTADSLSLSPLTRLRGFVDFPDPYNHGDTNLDSRSPRRWRSHRRCNYHTNRWIQTCPAKDDRWPKENGIVRRSKWSQKPTRRTRELGLRQAAVSGLGPISRIIRQH